MLTTSLGSGSGPCASESNASEWVKAHEMLSRLARERAATDAQEGRWLLFALRCAAHVHQGYGTFGEYVERLFGYKPRSTQEKLRVAEALEELPVIAEALETGALNWSAVRELTRVAVAETGASVGRGRTRQDRAPTRSARRRQAAWRRAQLSCESRVTTSCASLRGRRRDPLPVPGGHEQAEARQRQLG
jgi:hypothetical protein